MSTIMQHREAPVGTIHKLVNWEFDTDAARLAETTFTSLDVHKAAYVTESNTYYMVTAVNAQSGVATWLALITPDSLDSWVVVPAEGSILLTQNTEAAFVLPVATDTEAGLMHPAYLEAVNDLIDASSLAPQFSAPEVARQGIAYTIPVYDNDLGAPASTLSSYFLTAVITVDDTKWNFAVLPDLNYLNPDAEACLISAPPISTGVNYIGANALPSISPHASAVADSGFTPSNAKGIEASSILAGHDNVCNATKSHVIGVSNFITDACGDNNTILGGQQSLLLAGTQVTLVNPVNCAVLGTSSVGMLGVVKNSIITTVTNSFVGALDTVPTTSLIRSFVGTAKDATLEALTNSSVLALKDGSIYGLTNSVVSGEAIYTGTSSQAVALGKSLYLYGDNSKVIGQNLFAVGNSLRVEGKDAFQSQASVKSYSAGQQTLFGDNQKIELGLIGTTTDATPAALTKVGGGYLTIPVNSVLSGQYEMIVTEPVTGTTALYTGRFVMDRHASSTMGIAAGSSSVTEEYDNAGLPVTPLVITADAAGLKFTVTGAAATTYIWQVRIQAQQTLYAHSMTVVSVSSGSDTITFPYKVTPGAKYRFSGATLPGGITAGVDYYIRTLTGGDETGGFTASLTTELGSNVTVDITSSGSGTITATRY